MNIVWTAAILASLNSAAKAAEAPQRHLRYKGVVVTWQSDYEPTRKQFKVLDPEGRRIVFHPEYPPESGELELTWDAFPATVAPGQTFSVGFGGRVLERGKNVPWHTVELFPGLGFESDKNGRESKYVGMHGDGKIEEGRKTHRVSARALETLALDAVPSLTFGFGEVTIEYQYELVEGAAPIGKTVEGTWRWSTGTDVTLRPDGTVSAGDGRNGKWETVDRAGRGLRLAWSAGGDDFLVLSSDGQSLEGKSRDGASVGATRRK